MGDVLIGCSTGSGCHLRTAILGSYLPAVFSDGRRPVPAGKITQRTASSVRVALPARP